MRGRKPRVALILGTRGHGWRALCRLRLPEPQVFQDAPHHGRVVDQRDDAHRPLAFEAFERIGFVDLAATPARAACSLRDWDDDFEIGDEASDLDLDDLEDIE